MYLLGPFVALCLGLFKVPRDRERILLHLEIQFVLGHSRHFCFHNELLFGFREIHCGSQALIHVESIAEEGVHFKDGRREKSAGAYRSPAAMREK